VVVVVTLGSRLTFFNDDWYFLLQRPGLESHSGLNTLFAPHNSNCVVLTALAYKVLVALFGLGSQGPFRLVLGVAVAAVGVMVFALVRARVGSVFALACAAVVVFLGAAWEDLLFFAAAIDVVGSLATGLAAIWLLERDTRHSNVLGCMLLVCSVGFSNVGVPFAVTAGVGILLRGRPQQLWIPAVPLALFGLWWGLAGSSQPSHLSSSNVGHLPRYVYESLSAGLASITGLSRGTVSGTYARGHILLAVAVVVIVVALVRGWRPPATVLVPVAGALAFWILTGASFIPGREPFASRYQLVDAVFLLLIAAELLRGVQLGRFGAVVVVAAAVVIIWSNVDSQLTYGYRFLREQSAFVKADLGALEIGRRSAPADLWLTAEVAHNPYLSGVTAGRFFAETAAHGRVPTYSAEQLATAPPAQRQAADSVLAFAERIPPTRTSSYASNGQRCAQLRTGAAGVSRELPLNPGTWLLTDPGPTGLAIGVRRFAPRGLPVYIGLIGASWTERLVIPYDAVTTAWWLSNKGPATAAGARLEICRPY
jgi:hypothetical protein